MRSFLFLAGFAALTAVSVALPGCRDKPAPAGLTGLDAVKSAIPIYTYEVVNAWPHDRGAFTQGLLYLDGELFESTGLNGRSSLRRVELKTGKVLAARTVPLQYFAEGLALVGGKLFQLTWRNGRAFVYDPDSFRLEREFTYEGEGWGLTSDGQSLVMSDGSNQIRFRNPGTFEVNRTIAVLAGDQPVTGLNELEYIKGEIFANVWGTDYVLRIDPASGKINGIIDFSGLMAAQDRGPDTDVLNGIAYDPTGDRLFITGKCWPKLFEVKLRLKK